MYQGIGAHIDPSVGRAQCREHHFLTSCLSRLHMNPGCFVGLEFNGPVNTIKIMSIHLTTLFVGKVSSLSG